MTPPPLTCERCGESVDSRSTFCPACGTTVPDPLLGRVLLARYRPERRVAIGTFGSIYRATELSGGGEIALKVMHRELAADASLVERFRREGHVLTRLSSPHIVTTYELGETDDGLPFIAMELVAGDTLLSTLRAAGRLPWQRAVVIGDGVCRALAHAHALGIVHRDLKPANIMLTDAGDVKVLDFGIARILATSDIADPRELTIMGTAVGTLEYMAPEQLMGGKADGRSDIYTLGVLLYEIIVGQRPFNAAGFDLLTVQLAEPVPPPSQLVEVPAALEAILLRCLAADPDDRFPDVASLAAALASVPMPPPVRVITEGPASDTVPVRKPPARPVRLRRVVLVALMLVAALGFGVAMAWLR